VADVLAFWAVAVGTAALAFPIAQLIFRRFPDGGAGIALPLGLMLSGWSYFLLRVTSLLPFGRGGALVALALLGLAGAAAWGLNRRARSDSRRSAGAAWAMLALFTSAFLAYTAFRSYVPEIQGTEQPMDLLYLNAAVASPSYPPEDPWLAGHSASYYYFGYLQVGLLTQAAGVPSSVGYNLGLSVVFGAVVTGAVSVAVALARGLRGGRRGWTIAAAGFAAVLLLLFVGSLTAPFELAAAHGRSHSGLFRAFGLEWLLPCAPGQTERCYPDAARTSAWYPTEFWWWWRGTRVIPSTITEFPFFSFLLGDLHPHLMALPANLLAVALALACWRSRRPLPTRGSLPPAEGFRLAVTAILLGGLAFLNAWDVITFVLLVGAAAVGRTLSLRPRDVPLAAAWFLVVVGAGVLAYLPWWLDFRSQASGLQPYVGPGTRPAHALLQFGPVGIAALTGTIVLAARGRDAPIRGAFAVGLAVLVLPLAVWALFTLVRGDFETAIRARTTGGFVTLGAFAYGAAVSAMAAVALSRVGRTAEAAVAALAAGGLLLLYGAELFYIRDVFAGSAPRMNTVFKLSYQAWLLLSLAGAGGAAAVLASRRPALRLAAAPAALLAVVGLVYPVTSLPNRTDGFAGPTAIDGLAFLAEASPGEWALLQAIRNYVPPGAVVVEATGRTWRKGNAGPELVSANVDYTDAGRIAARTGRPTPIGWYFHELQWRGDSQANHRLLSARQELVDGVYLAPDAATALDRLRRLRAEYVVVGPVERSRYPADLMPRFGEFLVTVYDDGIVQLYRLPVERELPTS
jgi:YYY domain-containing protein